MTDRTLWTSFNIAKADVLLPVTELPVTSDAGTDGAKSCALIAALLAGAPMVTAVEPVVSMPAWFQAWNWMLSEPAFAPAV